MTGQPRLSSGDIDAAVAGIGLEAALQPIVALADEQIVGFEALARWPGTDLSPPIVFDHAVRTGRLDTLDSRCLEAAVSGAKAAGLPPMAMLAINCEPSSTHCRRAHHPTLDRVADEYRVVFEITERGLLEHPGALLTKIDAIRDDGFALALDDLGAHADSLALLDVVSPDIVKLDLDLVQRRPQRDQARTLSAVMSYRERSGALILAEGIETDAHHEQALALGATLGQGYKFGHPRPPRHTVAHSVVPRPLLGPVHAPAANERSQCPFDILVRDWGKPVLTARRDILVSLSRHIERQASDAVDPPMVLTALQHQRSLTLATRRRYEKISRTASLMAVFGCSLTDPPVVGVRGVDLDATDPLCQEWILVVLGARTSAALIAREHHHQPESTDDADRLFDFVITHDRTLVTAAARALLRRIN